uniref:Uncharacterized protein n=1 Tax=Mycena chlorophos TaxID=658473 RepID=A0ABQ0M6B2_MYCCL|nr:predicted protein [Mycena chlorophos]
MPDQPSQEAPLVKKRHIPAGGTFSLLRIDPVACVEHLEDPVATAACSNIKGKEYLVYASGATKLFHPDAAYIEVNIIFVMQGQPQDIPSECIDAAMSMPIAPQSSDTHPSGRKAFEMESGQVFPWADCYLSPFAKHVVRCASVLVDERPVCKLNRDGLFRYQLADIEDVNRRQDLKFELKSKQHDATAEQSRSEPVSDFIAQGAEGVGGDNDPGLSERPGGDEETPAKDPDAAHQELAELFRGFIQPEAGEDLTVAKFTYDLSRVKELNDPRLFFVEVREILGIISESLARKESEKEEVARKDAARYDSKTATCHLLLYGAALLTAFFLRLPMSNQGINEIPSTPAGRYIPTFGTFAALRIDPVACVAHLEDSAASAACSKIACKDYLIYAAGISKLFHPDAVFCEIDIIFIQRGQPRDIPERFIDASMTIPIAPQSAGKEHPSGRPPLKMAAGSAAFPWSDCYLSPFANHVVRTANVRVNETPVCLLDDDELMRLDGADMDDVGRQRALRFDHNQAHASASKAPTAVEAVSHTPEDERQEAESSGHAAEPTTEEREEDDKALLYSLIQPEASEELTAVTFTYDLTRSGEFNDPKGFFDEFNDPKGFFDEVQEISRIITESLARKEAAKEDVAKEDAACYDSKTAKLLHGHRLMRALGRVESFIRRILCLSPPADHT